MFGLDFIRKLKPCTWKFKPPYSDGRTHVGFIAQDINEIADYEKYSFVGRSKGFYNLNYNELLAPVVKAIQESDETIQILNKKIEKLEKKLNETNSNNSR